jgi:hypothetical protein
LFESKVTSRRSIRRLTFQFYSPGETSFAKLLLELGVVGLYILVCNTDINV